MEWRDLANLGNELEVILTGQAREVPGEELTAALPRGYAVLG